MNQVIILGYCDNDNGRQNIQKYKKWDSETLIPRMLIVTTK